jgi:predicted TIM-barrel fold metal-dependent hydrolase
MGSYIRFVNKLDLSAEDAERVFWRNSARVFGLDLQPAGGTAAVG